eukprot:TRINITY_DN5978_c0_g2_i1.p1 TRINITY_DN5978_c0_g2~~TRINITY_DN5978_c0_g2_i1.p1  ORF type:complete len:582 (+),score=133.49 TRINITY_DN5978_c0_g2_i1:102-1748(+)
MTLPPLEQWPQRPLFMRFAPDHPGPEGKQGAWVPINSLQMTPFETPDFVGAVHVAVRGAPNSQVDLWAPGEMWDGRNRRFVFTFRGRFKRRFRFDEVEMGCKWHKALAPPRGIGVAMNVCTKFCPGLRTDVCHPTDPYVLNILPAIADALHCWKNGDPPEERFRTDRVAVVTERGTGSLPNFKNVRERMRWLGRKHGPQGLTQLEQQYWEPDVEYAFDFYTHTLYLDRFEAHVPLGITHWILPLHNYLPGNPFPMTCRTRDGHVLFSFEVWHEKPAMHAPAHVWRQGQNALSPGGGDRVLGLHSPNAFRDPRAPELSPAPLLAHRKRSAEPGDDTLSFHSCNETHLAADADSIPSGDSVPGGDELRRTPPGSGEEEGHRTGDGRAQSATPVEAPRDGLGNFLVQWTGKRLRTEPKSRAPWASTRGALPVGTPVRILDKKDEKWARVQLPSGLKGWMRMRHLAPRDSQDGTGAGGSEEPAGATVVGKRKRLRVQPTNTAKRHGAYISQGSDCHVLCRQEGWSLVLLPGGAAGWMKNSNLEIDKDSDEEA